VDYFLFDLKKGYCDYYATSMTVLARSAGLPARLVLGYAGGHYDPYSAQYIVTKADAHAWTEVYFAGIGWIEFEPTANQLAIFHGEVGALTADAHPAAPDNGIWNPLPGIAGRQFRVAWWLAAAAGALCLFWLLLDRWYLGHMQPDEAMQRVYLRLRRLTHRMNGIPPAGQTAREYSGALATGTAALGKMHPTLAWFVGPLSNGIASLTDLYMQSLFAPDALSRHDSRMAIGVWLHIRWRLGLINILLVLSRRQPKAPSIITNVPKHEAG
jgi:hypothetical protein